MAGQQLVLASNNQKKIAEVQAILSSTGIKVVTQSSVGVGEVVEDGLSFVENALIKARHAAKVSGLPAIADDSGLEVDALNGAPGIYSARYSGEDASDESNNQKLLQALQGKDQRSARFYCAIVYLKHAEDPTPLIACGAWQGKILEQAQGKNGFGYDPLFYVPTHQCSSAQLAPDVKSQISHRGQALRHFAELYQEHCAKQ